MNSYLGLVKEYAKRHKRENRMTVLCIILAVFLVTAIFGMAEMEMRSQQISMVRQYGDWHVRFLGVTQEQAALMAVRPAVERSGFAETLMSEEYSWDGSEEPLYVNGVTEEITQAIGVNILRGVYPAGVGVALLTEAAAADRALKIGDTIRIAGPQERILELRISGIAEDTAQTLKRDKAGVMLSPEQFRQCFAPEEYDEAYVLKFTKNCNIQKEIASIMEEYGLTPEQEQQNAYVLATMGQSKDNYMQSLFLMAGFLVALVLVAGVLMITSSFQTHIAQRVQFFGMLRCIGASKEQIRRMVVREGLQYLKKALPAGVLAGTAMVWLLCAWLKYVNPAYFGSMPQLGISVTGVLAGCAIGFVSVLFSSMAPAGKAASVSPLSAVSGNGMKEERIKGKLGRGNGRIELRLGVFHAVSNRKTFFLMTASFAFSIILFLGFSCLLDFMGHALRPLKPWVPDLSLVSPDNSRSIPEETLRRLEAEQGIKKVYGRMFLFGIPASAGEDASPADLISYEKYQFEWAEDALNEGSLEAAQAGEGVLLVYGEGLTWKTGDTLTLQIAGEEKKVKVAGVLENSPFDKQEGVESLICSEELFRRLAGEEAEAGGYTILDIQLGKGTDEETVGRFRQLAQEQGLTFSDRRQSNQEVKTLHFSFSIFVYGFLVVISMISVFHVVNSMNMSISARMRQYGMMRAVGMSGEQLLSMVRAEAVSFGIAGAMAGALLGVPLYRFLFQKMVTDRWGTPWEIPAARLGFITAVMGITILLSVWGPSRRMRDMDVVDTLHSW